MWGRLFVILSMARPWKATGASDWVVQTKPDVPSFEKYYKTTFTTNEEGVFKGNAYNFISKVYIEGLVLKDVQRNCAPW